MGNYGAAKAKVSQYSKIGESIGISLSGYYDRNDGFFINEYNDTKADKEESAGGRFKLDWHITNHLKAQYTFNYDYVTQKPSLTGSTTHRPGPCNRSASTIRVPIGAAR